MGGSNDQASDREEVMKRHYHIIKATPGYMPWTEPYAVSTKTEAIACLKDEKRFTLGGDYEGALKIEGNAKDLWYFVADTSKTHDLGFTIEAWECADDSEDCAEQLAEWAS